MTTLMDLGLSDPPHPPATKAPVASSARTKRRRLILIAPILHPVGPVACSLARPPATPCPPTSRPAVGGETAVRSSKQPERTGAHLRRRWPMSKPRRKKPPRDGPGLQQKRDGPGDTATRESGRPRPRFASPAPPVASW